MKPYKRLTYTDRLIIEKCRKAGQSYRAIAALLDRSVSSIHYEVKRGMCDQIDSRTYETVKRYLADTAQRDAAYQATVKGSEIKLGKRYDYAKEVSSRILAGESPDSIVGSMKKSGSWTVSTPTLYRYIDNGYIPGITNKNLIRKSIQPKRTYRHVKAARPPKGPSIEKRPAHINDRSVPGHWEQDLVIGKREGKDEALLVLTERKYRYEICVKLHDKTTTTVNTALSQIVSRYPQGTFQSITVDNGSEFSDYEGMKKLVPEIYYCHPYSSYERGTNENHNILIRRFFPKGESMANKTQQDADAAAYFMNHMHRRILGYSTPQELFDVWQSELACQDVPVNITS